MKYFLFLLFLPLHLWSQPPQSPPAVQPLSLGATVPDLSLAPVLNHPKGALRLSDYQGKLVVLDFMATYCLSCLQALPRLDSLQQQFGDRLQILLVTTEPQEKVTRFLQNTAWGKKIRLPLVTNDSTLSALFPHRFLSHDVWMDGSRRVLAITGPDYLDAANVGEALSGRPLHWPVKRDLDYDYSQPLLTLNAQNTPPETVPAALYYSAFTSYRPGIAPRYNKGLADSSRGTVTVSMVNLSPWEMYKRAWQLRAQFPLTQLVLDVKDKSRLLYLPGTAYREAWNEANAYCYEAVLPLEQTHAQRVRKLRSDLDLFFGLQSTLQKRKVPCLVILDAGGPKKRTNSTIPGDATLSLSDLVWQWNQVGGNLPLLDERRSGIKRYLPAGQTLPENPVDLAALLKREGLELLKTDRELEVLVLQDTSR